jgi:phosphoglycerate dehydrogenase-like enzyme
MLSELRAECNELQFVQSEPENAAAHMGTATIAYGLPPLADLKQASALRWLQLTSAGVPQELCQPAGERGLVITNLAGLYGSSIAEHALALMVLLARNLHVAVLQQRERRWSRSIMCGMSDLQGKTLGVLGMGNIGQNIARLARAHGMRVLGWRRTDRPTPFVDRLYRPDELHALLALADYVAVALPLTAHTSGLLGRAEFQAMKRGVTYINVSRGGVAREGALLEALRSGQAAGAGLDVFAAEPLPPEHPLWSMPQVVVSPHCSGETVNQSALPGERFARNLRSWLAGKPLEGMVDLAWGY